MRSLHTLRKETDPLSFDLIQQRAEGGCGERLSSNKRAIEQEAPACGYIARLD